MMDENHLKEINGNAHQGYEPNMKRKRVDHDEVELPVCSPVIRGRSFFPIGKGSGIFSTDDWKPSGSSLFCPVKQDLYVNMTKYDQISATDGSFFTADEAGQFSKSIRGHVLHLWRYDKVSRKLFVCQSFLFTNVQDFVAVQSFLQNL